MQLNGNVRDFSEVQSSEEISMSQTVLRFLNLSVNQVRDLNMDSNISH